MTTPTPLARAFALRNYQRGSETGKPESWEQVVDRVIAHQRWLYERAAGRPLAQKEEEELLELRKLIFERRILPDERTLWLGGTLLSQTRESCMIANAFTHVETVYDLVDLFWLMLQGSEIGFHPIAGTLNGFRRPLQAIEIIPSERLNSGGKETNEEYFDPKTLTWTIKVGDSAMAWAKALGKLIAGKYPAAKLVLDFTEIRPAGTLLKGYGWPSGGDQQLAKAFHKIAMILSDRSDQLLKRLDILAIVNHLGTVLANPLPARKASQIALFDFGQPEWEEFAAAKKDWWLKNKDEENQSIHSLLFRHKPSPSELEKLFNLMMDSGGAQPSFINASAAEQRAPWFKGCSPNKEALLGNKGFYSSVEVNLLAFKGDKVGLERALTLAARMNYRQTLLNLHDGILQEAWHLNNEFLHLCGVGLTGIRARKDLTAYDFKRMRNIAVTAAFSMAQELGAPLPKNVTCIMPSKSLSKLMGTHEWGEVPEGIHLPMGKYMFELLPFLKSDPILEQFKQSGYQTITESLSDFTYVKFPVSYTSASFSHQNIHRKNGKIENLEINTDTITDQLNWYALLQSTWSEQNVSSTIHYEPSDVPAIIDWIQENWDLFIGVSFVFKGDPAKCSEDIDHQEELILNEIVTEEAYKHYAAQLQPLDLH